METYDPKSIFHTAKSFNNSSKFLWANFLNIGKYTTFAPAGTCAALALELYFKTLITIEKGGYERGNHDLYQYFSALSSTSQDKIRLYAAPRVDNLKDAIAAIATRNNEQTIKIYGFDDMLKASKNAFMKFRYHFEQTMEDGEGWTGYPISDAIRKVILDIHPEWDA